MISAPLALALVASSALVEITAVTMFALDSERSGVDHHVRADRTAGKSSRRRSRSERARASAQCRRAKRRENGITRNRGLGARLNDQKHGFETEKVIKLV